MSEPKLKICIPCFDRSWLLKHCLATLGGVRGVENADVQFFLDAGHEPEIAGLIDEAFPIAQQHRAKTNLGACGTIHKMLQLHAKAPDGQRMLIFDSDMIARTDLATEILSWPVRDDIWISVYNSCMHPLLNPSPARFVHKDSLGATGTVWTPALARMVLEAVPLDDDYDNSISRYFLKQELPMCSTNRSFVQHLGLRGANNKSFGALDYGINFKPDSPAQQAAMAEVFDDILSNQPYYMGERERRRRLEGS